MIYTLDERSGAYLVEINPTGRVPGPRTLTFSDGTDIKTSKSVVRAARLEDLIGETRDVIVTAVADVEQTQALERAIRYLGARDRSVWEVRCALEGAGFSAVVADRVLSRLFELELLDDVRFAAEWTRWRLGSGFGWRRVRHELRAKGVSDNVIDEIRLLFGADAERDRAAAAIRGDLSDAQSRKRAAARLVRRGFAPEDAWSAVSSGQSDTCEE